MAFLPSYPDAYLTNTALRIMTADEQATLMAQAYLHLSDCLLAHEADAGDDGAHARLHQAATQGCKLWLRWCAATPTARLRPTADCTLRRSGKVECAPFVHCLCWHSADADLRQLLTSRALNHLKYQSSATCTTCTLTLSFSALDGTRSAWVWLGLRLSRTLHTAHGH